MLHFTLRSWMKSVVGKAAVVEGCTWALSLADWIVLSSYSLAQSRVQPHNTVSSPCPRTKGTYASLDFSCSLLFYLTGNNLTDDLRRYSRGIFMPAHPIRHSSFCLLFFWQQVKTPSLLKNFPWLQLSVVRNDLEREPFCFGSVPRGAHQCGEVLEEGFGRSSRRGEPSTPTLSWDGHQ